MASRIAVQVPPHGKAGDPIRIEHQGHAFDCEVPDGYADGDTFELILPESYKTAREMEVVVPEGLSPGDVFRVESDDMLFEVILPEHVTAGAHLVVTLPQTAASTDNGAFSASETSTSSLAPCAHRVGQRVQVMRSSGEYSPAFIHSYHEPSGLYSVELFERGSSIFKDGLTEDDLASTWEQLYVPTSRHRPYASSSSDSSQLESDGDSDSGAVQVCPSASGGGTSGSPSFQCQSRMP